MKLKRSYLNRKILYKYEDAIWINPRIVAAISNTHGLTCSSANSTRFLSLYYFESHLVWSHQQSAPDLGGAQDPPPKRTPTMFMCLAIRATCGCHLVISARKVCLSALLIIIRPNSSISLEEYLILRRNNYYTYCFPESRSDIWI